MKSKHTFTVIFFTRKSRSVPNQLSIYVRITVDGQRAEISLKRNIPSKEWDNSRNRGRGGSQRIRALNAYLDSVYGELLDCHKELLEENRVVSSNAIKSRYLGEDDNSKTLRELIKYHYESQKCKLRPGTMKNYYGTEKYLKRFLEHTRRLQDINLKRLNYKFITDFENYLINGPDLQKGKKCTNNAAMKHLERLRKMVNLAVRLEWLDKDPFVNYKKHYKRSERSFFSGSLRKQHFQEGGMRGSRTPFFFHVITGLAYGDVKALEVDHLRFGIDGGLWIHTKREKTDEAVKVPLLPKAKQILDKYKDCNQRLVHGKLLPVLSNQKTNSYLKEIAKVCGIYKNISFHTARHTFASTVTLSNGVPMETVSKMLGHTKLTTTQIYARVLERKVGDDMQKLVERMEGK